MIQWGASDRLSYLNFSAPTVRQANHALDSLCSWYSEKLPVVVLSWHVLCCHIIHALFLFYITMPSLQQLRIPWLFNIHIGYYITTFLLRTNMLEQSISFFGTHEVMLTASRDLEAAVTLMAGTWRWYLHSAARAHCIMKLVRCSVAL